MMKNIKLCIAFSGGNYHGFQVQAGLPTISHTVQNALEKLLGVRPDIKGCSRTDAGVHAREYVLNFWSDTEIPMVRFPKLLGFVLPDDIVVLSAAIVENHFHARYDAIGKEYLYHVYTGERRDPFKSGFAWFVEGALDVARMKKAASLFVGEHDFYGFSRNRKRKPQSTIREIWNCEVKEVGEEIQILIAAESFLWNMVRILVGTLVYIGQGKMEAEDILQNFICKDRNLAGSTAPAEGLVLNRVFYDKMARQTAVKRRKHGRDS